MQCYGKESQVHTKSTAWTKRPVESRGPTEKCSVPPGMSSNAACFMFSSLALSLRAWSAGSCTNAAGGGLYRLSSSPFLVSPGFCLPGDSYVVIFWFDLLALLGILMHYPQKN